MGAKPSEFHDYDPQFGPPLEITSVEPGPNGEPVFEIGIVLAGAVSAGAYTGGVMDFLTEALDAFEAAKAKLIADGHADRSLWPIPGHSVRIKVVSGASAGGMTAAMLATSQDVAFPHIHNGRDAKTLGRDNPYYDAWVNRIDITGLLGTKDLNEGVVHSLLDCTPLDDIVKAVLDFPDHARSKGIGAISRTWLASAPSVCVTITNMRGIPYSFRFPDSENAVYSMTRHADCQRFVLAPAGAAQRGDQIRLTPGSSSSADESWNRLGQAALATGSFPIALRSRTIKPTPDFYRSYHISTFEPRTPQTTVPALSPNQRAGTMTVSYVNDVRTAHDGNYASADGGIIDNEPLELAHVELAGIIGRNPRDAQEANRALLMVYPFPELTDDRNFHDADRANVLQLGIGLISTLKEQARFHPDDIDLALDPNVYSRFVIYPRRKASKSEPVHPAKALACGALGAFSGFLCEDYRRHDYLLGRANCWAFLKENFALPIDGGVESIELFKGQPHSLSCDIDSEEDGYVMRRYRPIIPLCETAIPKPEEDPWPIDKVRPEDFARLIRTRIRAVGNVVLESGVKPPMRKIFQLWWGQLALGRVFRWWVANRAVQKVRRELELYGLLTTNSRARPPS